MCCVVCACMFVYVFLCLFACLLVCSLACFACLLVCSLSLLVSQPASPDSRKQFNGQPSGAVGHARPSGAILVMQIVRLQLARAWQMHGPAMDQRNHETALVQNASDAHLCTLPFARSDTRLNILHGPCNAQTPTLGGSGGRNNMISGWEMVKKRMA